MKLYCLSSDASKPCFVLSFKELLIMLDCGLSAHSVLNFLPLPPVPSTRLASLPNYTPPHVNDPLLEGELKECCGRVFVDSIPEFCPPLDKVVDFSQLDVILISNYTCMMALPFITEDTGFKGQVYATEPTLQIGRFYLEELAEWVSGAGGGGAAARRWKELLHVLPAPLSLAARPRAWRRLFAPAAVARSLARVRVVGYDERVDVYGALDATAVSSGFCLGSANWVLRSAREKVAYVSGSSTLTTHPRPINQAALRGADLLVLAALTQTPAHNPDHMLGDLCVHAAVTLRAGGCVLCPVYPSGVLYDLLECLSAHLDTAGLQHVPLYVVSPVADSSLAYSNILAEWVSVGKQARVYLPEEPFPHAALARAGRLRHAKHLHDDAFSAEFRQPCVVFCGHPSLRFGAAVHLVELWANNPAHAIIFTEPDFPHTEALAPFQPLSMKAFHCPIDTSLNYSQANKLVRELRPRELALPDQYAPPPHHHPAPRYARSALSSTNSLHPSLGRFHRYLSSLAPVLPYHCRSMFAGRTSARRCRRWWCGAGRRARAGRGGARRAARWRPGSPPPPRAPPARRPRRPRPPRRPTPRCAWRRSTPRWRCATTGWSCCRRRRARARRGRGRGRGCTGARWTWTRWCARWRGRASRRRAWSAARARRRTAASCTCRGTTRWCTWSGTPRTCSARAAPTCARRCAARWPRVCRTSSGRVSAAPLSAAPLAAAGT